MPAQIQFFDGPRAQVLLLGGEPVVIGGRDSRVKVPGATVSRQQARLIADAGHYWIEDLGGDGVSVNGEAVQRRRLENRDKIRIGALDVEFFDG